jgi:hypothetical protein
MADRAQSTTEPVAKWIKQALDERRGTLAFFQRRSCWLVPQKTVTDANIQGHRPGDVATWRLRGEWRISAAPIPRVEPPRVHIESTPGLERFGMVRKYEGRITRRVGETFWAEVRENPGDFPPIQAEFDVMDLPESDRPLAVEGMPLVWTLGVQIEHGTHKQQSIVYVRRIPFPSPTEIEESEVEVEHRMRAIPWE